MEERTGRRIHIAAAAAAFVLTILWLLFASPILSQVFGVYASLISELFLAFLALAGAAVCRAPLRSVFPMERICFRQVAGVLVLYFGSSYLVSGVAMFTQILFPEGLTDSAEYITELAGSLPFLLCALMICVMPAVCEEMLFRGLIQNSLSGIRSRAVVIIIMGTLFGIVHLDIYRFLITGILGAVITYIMLETKNILLPALFHFINNGMSLMSAYYLVYLSDMTGMSGAADYLAQFGSDAIVGKLSVIASLSYAIIAPFVIFAGVLLLRKNREKTPERKRSNKRLFISAAVVSAVFLTGSIAYLIFG